MPDDLRSQLQPLLDCVEAMGLPLAAHRRRRSRRRDRHAREAGAPRNDIDVLISTGDKDMAQLVDERITLVNTMTGLAARSRGRQEQVRRVSGADRRLPRAGRRQHPTTFPAWPRSDRRPPRSGSTTTARSTSWSRTPRAITGKVGESLRASLQGSGAVAQARNARLEPSRSTHDAGIARARASRTGNACASCTRGSSCARCCVSSGRRRGCKPRTASPTPPAVAAGRSTGRAAGELRVDRDDWQTCNDWIERLQRPS